MFAKLERGFIFCICFASFVRLILSLNNKIEPKAHKGLHARQQKPEVKADQERSTRSAQ
jgi:hypothetical protein